MIDVKLKVLKTILLESISNIDLGNSNFTELEIDVIIKDLIKLNKGIKRISKREACESIIKCSSSTFDNYIKLGIIPKGHKEIGFKELSWSENDFNEVVMNKVRKYTHKQGL